MFCGAFLMLMHVLELRFGRSGKAGQKMCSLTAVLFDMKEIYTTLSGSWRLLTVVDMRCDKCTLIYRGNKAVLCESGTLKIGVNVI